MTLVEIHREVAQAAHVTPWRTLLVPVAAGALTSLVALGGVLWSNRRTLQISERTLDHAERQATRNRRWELDQRRHDTLRDVLSELVTAFQVVFRAQSSEWFEMKITEKFIAHWSEQIRDAPDDNERSVRETEYRAVMKERHRIHDAGIKEAATALNRFLLAFAQVQMQAGQNHQLMPAFQQANDDLGAWINGQSQASRGSPQMGKSRLLEFPR